jgi:anti-sigma B factor antagonist
LSVSELTFGGEPRLAVEGELDMAGAPALLEEVERFEADRPDGVIAVDLTGVTFMDVAGMRVLLAAAERARRRGARFVIYNPRRIAQRVFSLTAVDQQLEILFDEDGSAS